MLDAFNTAVWILLLAKVAWNLCLPYVFLWRIKRSDVSYGSSISIMPGIECLLILVLLALQLPGTSRGLTAVLVYGLGAIVGSYIHLIVAGAVCGVIAKRKGYLEGRNGIHTDRPSEK